MYEVCLGWVGTATLSQLCINIYTVYNVLFMDKTEN